MAQGSAVRTVSEVSVLLTGKIGSYIDPATSEPSIQKNRGAGSEFMSQRTVKSMLEIGNNTMHLVKQEVPCTSPDSREVGERDTPAFQFSQTYMSNPRYNTRLG